MVFICNSVIASTDFCRLLKTFTNSLVQDQDRQNVSPDLDQTMIGILKEFLKKVYLEKSQQTTTKAWKYERKVVNIFLCLAV